MSGGYFQTASLSNLYFNNAAAGDAVLRAASSNASLQLGVGSNVAAMATLNSSGITVGGSIAPRSNNLYNLGSATNAFANIWSSNITASNINLASVSVSTINASNLTLKTVATSNITASNVILTNLSSAAGAAGVIPVTGILAANIDQATLNLGTATASTVNIGTASATQTVNIGTGSGVTTINIGGAGDTVNVAGTLTYINTTSTTTSDKFITLNKGGAANSGSSTGFLIEQAGATAGYIQTDSTGAAFLVKAPQSVGTVTLGSSTAGGNQISTTKGGILVDGAILPASNVLYDIGSSNARFRDIYLSGNTINLGGTKISIDSTTSNVRFADSQNKLKTIVASALQIGDNTVTGAQVYTLSNVAGVIQFMSTSNGVTTAAPVGASISNLYSSNGLIGIGNSNPAYALDVVGTINASQVLVNGAALTVGSGGSGGTGTGSILTVDPSQLYTMNQLSKLMPSDASASDMFSYNAIAVSSAGDLMAVGASQKNSGAGKVYIFTRNTASASNGWSAVASSAFAVNGSDAGAAGENLGSSVSVAQDASGNKVVLVGASGSKKAYAYVFTTTAVGSLTANKWNRVTIASQSGSFGASVSIVYASAVSGYYAAVGDNVAAGNVYTYFLPVSSYSPAARTTVSGTGASDYAGSSVSLSGDGAYLAVGAPGAVNATIAGGAVLIYARSASGATATYALSKTLTASDAAAGALFGSAVAFDATGANLAVGAPGASTSSGIQSGEVYVYNRAGSWSESKLLAAETVSGDALGSSITIDATGLYVAAGAPYAANNGLPSSGAAYLFAYSNASWSYTQKIKPLDPAPNVSFGQMLSLTSGASFVTVGAYNNTASAVSSGAVYWYNTQVTNFQFNSLSNAVTISTNSGKVINVIGSNIGVMNSNPLYPLDILGDVNFTGVMRSNGIPMASLAINSNSDPHLGITPATVITANIAASTAGISYSNASLGSNALVFPSNTTSIVYMPNSVTTTSATTGITFSALVNFASLDSWSPFISLNSSGTQRWQFGNHPSGSFFFYQVKSDGDNYGITSSTSLFTANQTALFTASMAADGTMAFYKNGAAVTAGTRAGSSASRVPTNFTYTNVFFGPIQGSIFFAAVYNQVLTPAQVLAQYNQLNAIAPSYAYSLYKNVSIGSNLYLGVGKTNVIYPLDVAGDVNFTGILRSNGVPYVGSQWSSSNGYLTYSSNVTVGGTLNIQGQLLQNGAPYQGSQFSTVSGNIVYLGAGSNLGLGGNSNAAAALDVLGDIKLSGNLVNSSTSLNLVGSTINCVVNSLTPPSYMTFSPSGAVATAATNVSVGGLNYTIYKINSGCSMTLTQSASCYLMLVGGGGGGSGGGGAGGGGGGVVVYGAGSNNGHIAYNSSAYTFAAGTYTVSIGGGGNPGANWSNAGNGGETKIVDANNNGPTIAIGGGGGGSAGNGGNNGGCGGGGGNGGAIGVGSQGYNGGHNGIGGGGGGAGGAGGDGDFGPPGNGYGGSGYTWNVGTYSVTVAGGGGGGGLNVPGGSGGGGDGSYWGYSGNPGAGNTGGGGGGTNDIYGGGNGQNAWGGSGVIYLAVPNAATAVYVGSNASVGLGGNTAPQYALDVKGDVNVSGNFKVNGTNLGAGPSAQYTPVRYIRWWMNGSSVGTGNEFTELKAFDTSFNNLALGKDVAPAVGTYSYGTPSMITDGDYNTQANYLAMTAGQAVAITVDLGKIYTSVAMIQLWGYWYDGRTRNGVQVDVSTDNSTWNTIFGPQNSVLCTGLVVPVPLANISIPNTIVNKNWNFAQSDTYGSGTPWYQASISTWTAGTTKSISAAPLWTTLKTIGSGSGMTYVKIDITAFAEFNQGNSGNGEWDCGFIIARGTTTSNLKPIYVDSFPNSLTSDTTNTNYTGTDDIGNSVYTRLNTIGIYPDQNVDSTPQEHSASVIDKVQSGVTYYYAMIPVASLCSNSSITMNGCYNAGTGGYLEKGPSSIVVEEMLTGTTAGTTTVVHGGTVLQVLSVTTSDQTHYNTSSWTDISSLQIQITPKKANSKIIISGTVNIGGGTGDSRWTALMLRRNGTNLSSGTSLGTGGTPCFTAAQINDTFMDYMVVPIPINYVDTPASMSQQTYTVAINTNLGGGSDRSAYLNRCERSGDDAYRPVTVSTFTIMEIDSEDTLLTSTGTSLQAIKMNYRASVTSSGSTVATGWLDMVNNLSTTICNGENTYTPGYQLVPTTVTVSGNSIKGLKVSQPGIYTIHVQLALAGFGHFDLAYVRSGAMYAFYYSANETYNAYSQNTGSVSISLNADDVIVMYSTQPIYANTTSESLSPTVTVPLSTISINLEGGGNGIATTSSPGSVQVGSGLSVTTGGVLSLAPAIAIFEESFPSQQDYTNSLGNVATWNTRILNSTQFNNSALTLSNNQITIPIGTYLVRANLTTTNAQLFKSRLYNVTTSTEALTGLVGFGQNQNNLANWPTIRSEIEGVIVVSAQNVFALQQYYTLNIGANEGWGVGAGDNEIYARISFMKIA